MRIRPGSKTHDHTLPIQAALLSAKSNQIDTLLFEKGHYFISEPLLPYDSLVILGIGLDEVIIEQTVWGHPAFDLINISNVSISEMQILTRQPRQYPNGFASRGTDGFVGNAGIYSNGHSSKFKNLEIEGFTCGLFLSSWNGIGLYEQKINNQVSDIEVSRVDFGILATGQKDLAIKNISGSYEQQLGSTASPHLIYISDANDPAYVWSEDLTIRNCYAENAKLGIAYQIGSVRGGSLSNLNARRCNGILAVKRIFNFEIDSLIAYEDNSPEAGSVFILPDQVENLHINFIFIESLNPKARLLRLDGKNNVYENIYLSTAISTITDMGIITMEGESSVLKNVFISNQNAQAGGLGVRLQGKNQMLENLNCNNCNFGFSIMQDCFNCNVTFDSRAIGHPTGDNKLAPNFNYSTTSRLVDHAQF